MYCRPAPDYLPDPESCLLTGITPQLCLERGLPEHEFAARIEAEPGPARHHRRGLQHDPLRRRDHALHVLAQPDRSLCAGMAERMRPLGPAGRGAPDLRAAPRRYRVAAQGGRVSQPEARAPVARQRPGARGRARCPVGRARHDRAGEADPAAAAEAVRVRARPAPQGPRGRGTAPARHGRYRAPLPPRIGHVPGGPGLPGHPVAARQPPDQPQRA